MLDNLPKKVPMSRTKNICILILFAFSFSHCNQSTDSSNKCNHKILKKRIKPASNGYHLEKTKDWLKRSPLEKEQNIVQAVNRTDKNNITKMDSVIVPNDVSGDIEFYLPFPTSVPFIKDISKIIFFSYATQSFAAYELGEMVYTGQTNMGRQANPTPTGLYYTNWKAEKTTSTFNDEWELKWNFNIENDLGVGFHQYELPGYPASHSCLRLTEKDAKYLYNWSDQWILHNPDSIKAKGTPVIVFGAYDFNSAKPWLKLIADAQVLDISENIIQQQAAPFMQDLLFQQQKRTKVEMQ